MEIGIRINDGKKKKRCHYRLNLLGGNHWLLTNANHQRPDHYHPAAYFTRFLLIMKKSFVAEFGHGWCNFTSCVIVFNYWSWQLAEQNKIILIFLEGPDSFVGEIKPLFLFDFQFFLNHDFSFLLALDWFSCWIMFLVGMGLHRKPFNSSVVWCGTW